MAISGRKKARLEASSLKQTLSSLMLKSRNYAISASRERVGLCGMKNAR
ncbi:MAG: hypothetical protein IJT59_06285 [Desulfovibrionaceae bacterium]|nr:hypothetical protein [Desulfovibrionaceae bacterium]